MSRVIARIAQVLQVGFTIFLLWYSWQEFFVFSRNQQHAIILGVFFTVAFILALRPIPLNLTETAAMSLSDVVDYAAIFAFPFQVCVWYFAVAYTAIIGARLITGRSRRIVLLLQNIVIRVIGFGAGAYVLDQVAGQRTLDQLFFHNDWLLFPSIIMVWIVVVGTYNFNWAVGYVNWLNTGYFDFLRSLSDFVQTEDIIAVFLGALIAVLYPSHPYAACLVAGPLLLFGAAGELHVKSLRDSSALIYTLVRTLELSDPLEKAHSERVAYYAKGLADKLGKDANYAKEMFELGLIQDLGIISVPDRIMYKMGSLELEEWERVRRHPSETVRIVQHIPRIQKHLFALESHHERWDGMGYPNGLTGEAIPYAARLLAVADAYDAMMSDYPFRKKLSRKVALRRIWLGRGRQFDPEMVKALLLFAEEPEPVLKKPFEERPILWVVAEAAGRETGFSAWELDDLHEAAIMHEVNPQYDIFAEPGKKNPYGAPLMLEDHVLVYETLREDFPSSEEAIKIIERHHYWYDVYRDQPGYVSMKAWVLAVAEGLADYIKGGLGWQDGLARMRDLGGIQFHPDALASLERALEKGMIPQDILEGKMDTGPVEPPLMKAAVMNKTNAFGETKKEFPTSVKLSEASS